MVGDGPGQATSLQTVSKLDRRWAEEVAQMCDPIFEAADVGFERQVQYTDDQQKEVVALLWEADPQRFAER